jgi:serine/threonine-protein phosphatase 6 regulatory subunit 3
MAFWRFGFNFTASAIDALFERQDLTIEELLDEDELLQELKAHHNKLVEFLSKPEILKQLVDYLTVDPDENADIRRRYKFPYVACEILCCEIDTIFDAFFSNEALVEKLFSFLNRDTRLSTLLANYFTNVVNVMLTKRQVKTLDFIQVKDWIVRRIIDHIGTAAILDFLLKLIGDEENHNLATQQWLARQNLVPLLIAKLDPKLDSEVHRNTSQALVDIITTAGTNQPTPLLDQLQEEAQMAALLNNLLNPTLQHGLQVPIELLKRLNTVNEELLTMPADLPSMLKVVLKRLNDFHTMLKSPPDHPVTTTIGAINPPVGNNRIKITEFFVHLVRTNYEGVTQEIIKVGVIKTCLSLFFQYHWNNFLHQAVLELVQSILEGPSDELRAELFKPETKLLEQILEANSKNEEIVSKPKGHRLGFMGHITIISNAIVKAGEKYPETIGSQLEKHEKWQQYAGFVLTEILKTESRPLGGHKPLATNEDNSSDEDVFDRVELDKDSAELAFARYLCQQGFTNDFPDDFDRFDDDDDDDDEDDEIGDIPLEHEDEFDQRANFSTDDQNLRDPNDPFSRE